MPSLQRIVKKCRNTISQRLAVAGGKHAGEHRKLKKWGSRFPKYPRGSCTLISAATPLVRFFKDFLFLCVCVRERESKRERAQKQGEGHREKLSREADAGLDAGLDEGFDEGLDPRTRGSRPETKADA